MRSDKNLFVKEIYKKTLTHTASFPWAGRSRASGTQVETGDPCLRISGYAKAQKELKDPKYNLEPGRGEPEK